MKDVFSITIKMILVFLALAVFSSCSNDNLPNSFSVKGTWRTGDKTQGSSMIFTAPILEDPVKSAELSNVQKAEIINAVDDLNSKLAALLKDGFYLHTFGDIKVNTGTSGGQTEDEDIKLPRYEYRIEYYKNLNAYYDGDLEFRLNEEYIQLFSSRQLQFDFINHSTGWSFVSEIRALDNNVLFLDQYLDADDLSDFYSVFLQTYKKYNDGIELKLSTKLYRFTAGEIEEVS